MDAGTAGEVPGNGSPGNGSPGNAAGAGNGPGGTPSDAPPDALPDAPSDPLALDAERLASPPFLALFDAGHYRAGLRAAGVEGVERLDERGLIELLRERGAALRVSPSPFFDESHYIGLSPDLAQVAAWGFAHFLVAGLSEGRTPHPLIDPAYIARDQGVARDEALGIWLERETSPHPAFWNGWARWGAAASLEQQRAIFAGLSRHCPDPALAHQVLRYLPQLLDPELAGWVPIWDLVARALGEGAHEALPSPHLHAPLARGADDGDPATPTPLLERLVAAPDRYWSPDPRLDMRHYALANPDVEATWPEGELCQHFLRHGQQEGRVAHAMFDAHWYRLTYGLGADRSIPQHFAVAVDRRVATARSNPRAMAPVELARMAGITPERAVDVIARRFGRAAQVACDAAGLPGDPPWRGALVPPRPAFAQPDGLERTGPAALSAAVTPHADATPTAALPNVDGLPDAAELPDADELPDAAAQIRAARALEPAIDPLQALRSPLPKPFDVPHLAPVERMAEVLRGCDVLVLRERAGEAHPMARALADALAAVGHRVGVVFTHGDPAEAVLPPGGVGLSLARELHALSADYAVEVLYEIVLGGDAADVVLVDSLHGWEMVRLFGAQLGHACRLIGAVSDPGTEEGEPAPPALRGAVVPAMRQLALLLTDGTLARDHWRARLGGVGPYAERVVSLPTPHALAPADAAPVDAAPVDATPTDATPTGIAPADAATEGPAASRRPRIAWVDREERLRDPALMAALDAAVPGAEWHLFGDPDDAPMLERDEPARDEPASDEPASDEPVRDEPMTDDPRTDDRPVDEQPTNVQPADGQPMDDRPTDETASGPSPPDPLPLDPLPLDPPPLDPMPANARWHGVLRGAATRFAPVAALGPDALVRDAPLAGASRLVLDARAHGIAVAARDAGATRDMLPASYPHLVPAWAPRGAVAGALATLLARPADDREGTRGPEARAPGGDEHPEGSDELPHRRADRDLYRAELLAILDRTS